MDLIQNKDPKHGGAIRKFFKLDQTKDTPDRTQTNQDTPTPTNPDTKTKRYF
jgi:hypothetical protein